MRVDILTNVDASPADNRVLRADHGAASLGRGGGRDGGAVSRARRSGARPHPERSLDERRLDLRLRARGAAWARPADRQSPPEEAAGRRPARPRAAWQVGVLLDQPGGGGAARRPSRPGRRTGAMTTTADELRAEVRRRYAEAAL